MKKFLQILGVLYLINWLCYIVMAIINPNRYFELAGKLGQAHIDYVWDVVGDYEANLEAEAHYAAEEMCRECLSTGANCPVTDPTSTIEIPNGCPKSF